MSGMVRYALSITGFRGVDIGGWYGT
jgi:hypothetical protein